MMHAIMVKVHMISIDMFYQLIREIFAKYHDLEYHRSYSLIVRFYEKIARPQSSIYPVLRSLVLET